MSKRRRETRDDQIFKICAIISVLLSLLISYLISKISDFFNLKTFVIVFFISLIVTNAITIVLALPSVKGKIGEKKVSKVLNSLMDKYGGYVINDVMIPGEDNKTSQIDHIYVSEYGVFVVETKNYAGRIYGNDNQQNWTQVLAYGHSKHKLYNPVKQNQTHIYRLKELINTDFEFKSVIVFVKGNTRYIESRYVYTLKELKNLITSKSLKIITDLEARSINNKIVAYKENPVKTNKEHIAEIKTMLNNIDSNICPRCGGQLLLKKSKMGTYFYGCGNYPRCTFVKKEVNKK